MKYIASTIVKASDIGLNNYLFGGILLGWLDSYGALFTYKYLHHTFVTYKMEKTYFFKPAEQGDCIDFYVTNLKFDKISVNFDLVAKINSCKPAKEIINTNMTFVAIDKKEKRPSKINPFLFEQEEYQKWMKQKVINAMPSDETVYHNQNHVNEMLSKLSLYNGIINNNDYKLLYAAICYHDLVHIPGDEKNEEKSIEIMRRDFNKILTEDELHYISDLILCTKTDYDYEEIKKVKYADLIHDLDMISFLDYDVMKNNDVKIKSEYLNFSPLDFYKYKSKYFKRLIKDGIFISEQYKPFNALAIENVKRYNKEIKSLIEDLEANQ